MAQLTDAQKAEMKEKGMSVTEFYSSMQPDEDFPEDDDYGEEGEEEDDYGDENGDGPHAGDKRPRDEDDEDDEEDEEDDLEDRGAEKRKKEEWRVKDWRLKDEEAIIEGRNSFRTKH